MITGLDALQAVLDDEPKTVAEVAVLLMVSRETARRSLVAARRANLVRHEVIVLGGKRWQRGYTRRAAAERADVAAATKPRGII